jgi:cyclohexa-1,5-dienecarbonyl-CoA hydratase
MNQPPQVWFERGGRLLRLRLARPKANIVDAAMIAALAEALATHAACATG